MPIPAARLVALVRYQPGEAVPPNMGRVFALEYAHLGIVPPGLKLVSGGFYAPTEVTPPGLPRIAAIQYASEAEAPRSLKRLAVVGASGGGGGGPVTQPLFEDLFDRADAGVLGTAPTGQTWVAAAGTWGISSSEGACTSDGSGDRCGVGVGVVDGTVEAHLRGQTNTPNWRYLRLVLRAIDGNNYLSLYVLDGILNLEKLDNASPGTLAQVTLAAPLVSGATTRYKAVCVGTSLTISVDDVQVMSHTLVGGDVKYAGVAATSIGAQLQRGGTPTVAARMELVRVTVP